MAVGFRSFPEEHFPPISWQWVSGRKWIIWETEAHASEESKGDRAKEIPLLAF